MAPCRKCGHAVHAHGQKKLAGECTCCLGAGHEHKMVTRLGQDSATMVRFCVDCTYSELKMLGEAWEPMRVVIVSTPKENEQEESNYDAP